MIRKWVPNLECFQPVCPKARKIRDDFVSLLHFLGLFFIKKHLFRVKLLIYTKS
jgi:hypothetical protein